MKLFKLISLGIICMLGQSMHLYGKGDTIVVNTVDELVKYASKDGNIVKLKEGTYDLDSDFKGELLMIYPPANQKTKDLSKSRWGGLLNISGNDNVFDLRGTKIRIDNRLLSSCGKNKVFECLVSGNNNVIYGLNIEDYGDMPPANSAVTLNVKGDDNILKNTELYVVGSVPYGYGHLLGKGAKYIYKHKKHSSLLITGTNTQILNAKVVTHAYGHGIVIQGAVNTLIKDSYVEGKMRSTDEMLKETSGPAHSVGFKSIYPPGYIEKGHMLALSEDAYRAYPSGANRRRTKGITIINCTAYNMRGAFPLALASSEEKILVKDCKAIACQSGYSVPSNGVIEGCSGDAMYGALLSFPYKHIKNCRISLTLKPETSEFMPSRLLEINGYDHFIEIGLDGKLPKGYITPIVFGESERADMAFFENPKVEPKKVSGAVGVELVNRTGLPILLNDRCENCKITTGGKVTDNGIRTLINGK